VTFAAKKLLPEAEDSVKTLQVLDDLVNDVTARLHLKMAEYCSRSPGVTPKSDCIFELRQVRHSKKTGDC